MVSKRWSKISGESFAWGWEDELGGGKKEEGDAAALRGKYTYIAASWRGQLMRLYSLEFTAVG